MLQSLLKNGLASLTRPAESGRMRDEMTVLVTAHINRDGEQTGAYQIQISKFMRQPHEVIECGTYDELVANLLPGEAESDEWIDI